MFAGFTQIALFTHFIMTTAAAAVTSSLLRAVCSKTSTTGGLSSILARNIAYLLFIHLLFIFQSHTDVYNSKLLLLTH